MAKLDVIKLNGEKASTVELNDAIWNIEVNEIVLSEAVRLQMASLRQGTHKTKNRSEVSGGGRKPWRQKGTGRARQGSIRAPHWVGGGIVFGPTPRSHSFKMNKKERNEESKKNKEFFEAVKLLSKDTGVTVDAMCESIQNVLIGALKKEYNNKDIVFCDVDADKGEFRVYLRKTVVSEISDPDTDLLVEQAQQYKKGAMPGDIVEIPVETAKVSRITAEKGKHMLRQAIREAEQGQLRSELESHNQEIITVTVQRVIPESGDAVVSLGKTEAVLYKSEQLPDEVLQPNDIIKVYVAGVRSTDKNTRATISRTHPGLVRRLFEEEVPEIFDGTVEIKAVAREAGSRTKMAVYSADPDVDPVGACIGPRGARVGKIVDLLGGEKIDIVKYSDVPEEFIAAALAPADVVDVTVEEGEEKVCRVRVPDSQLSLAIGNKGQNARLAAKLTGWKIDIKPESGIEEPTINFDI